MLEESPSIPEVARKEPAGMEAARSRVRRVLIGLSLGLILSLAAFLRFYELGAHHIGNIYYAATVKSMLTSWHNFFFASFEPGGSVTVDKPPLGFWVQAVSAYFLGVNGFSLALPNALAGVFSVGVLFLLVRRQFGAGAALMSALALAITPVTVSTERNNTIDGLLVFVLLLAAWAFVKATSQGKMRFLLLGAFLVGLGFNIKMLQAYMPLPAFYGLYLLAARHPWWKRVYHLVVATTVLLVVSLSWAVIVDLTPPENRPYIGSSKDNTVMELILGHNGLSRLIAMRRLDRPANGLPQPNPPTDNPPIVPPVPPPYGPPRPVRPPLPPGPPADQPPFPGYGSSPLPSPQPRTPFSNEVGEPGWDRLFTLPLAGEASWLLPFALLALPLLVLQNRWRSPLSASAQGVLLWAGWLLPEVIYFSFTSGIMHAYYLVMLAPPLAALVGASAWSFCSLHLKRPWLTGVLIVLFGVLTLAFQCLILKRADANLPMLIGTSSVLLLAGFALVWWKRPAWLHQAGVALVCLSLFVLPLYWSLGTSLNAAPDVMLPRAGPSSKSPDRPISADTLSPLQARLVEFLLQNTSPGSYLVATLRANEAAPFIIATGRPVFTFGGFTGSDDIVDVAGLAQMVSEGTLRFVLWGDELMRQKPDLARWVQQACRRVDWALILGERGGQGTGGLRPQALPVVYDCLPPLP